MSRMRAATVDIQELHARSYELLELVKPRVDEPNWDSAYSLLYHGEEEEFLDLLLAILSRCAVPLSRDELSRLGELIACFGMTEADQGLYRYLADPRILDRMTVVDGPPS